MKDPIIEVICDDPRRASVVLKDLTEILDVQAFGDRLHLVMRRLDLGIEAVKRRLSESGIRIEKWRSVPPSLENVFISMTRGASREQ
jgi:hypothetical protein